MNVGRCLSRTRLTVAADNDNAFDPRACDPAVDALLEPHTSEHLALLQAVEALSEDQAFQTALAKHLRWNLALAAVHSRRVLQLPVHAGAACPLNFDGPA